MKESKAMMKKEVSFMKKKGAPKSMIKHEAREHESMGMMKKGVKKMFGGGVGSQRAGSLEQQTKRAGVMGAGQRLAKGGMASSYRRAADGIASKGKTKGKQVRMYGGGKC
jgi:hypothetical protein